MTKNFVVRVRLDEEQKRRLVVLAAADGSNESTILRTALDLLYATVGERMEQRYAEQQADRAELAAKVGA